MNATETRKRFRVKMLIFAALEALAALAISIWLDGQAVRVFSIALVIWLVTYCEKRPIPENSAFEDNDFVDRMLRSASVK